jgi:hypothetical protein
MDQYTHDLTDRTASALDDFSKGLMKIFCLRPGKTCNVIISYDDAPPGTRHTEAMAYVELNEDGVYFFNDVEIGDIEQAIHVYSMMCAEVVKSIASDEKREDYFEDLDRKDSNSDDSETDRQIAALLASVEDSPKSGGTELDDDECEIIENYKFA